MTPSPQLRALRLWHWQQLTACRERARLTPGTAECARQNALADKHLGFVQVLNDFFPVGDTAERDAR